MSVAVYEGMEGLGSGPGRQGCWSLAKYAGAGSNYLGSPCFSGSLMLPKVKPKEHPGLLREELDIWWGPCRTESAPPPLPCAFIATFSPLSLISDVQKSDLLLSLEVSLGLASAWEGV